MRHTIHILLPILFLFPATSALARVTGLCVNCHTMHNSQGGVPMAVDRVGAAQNSPNDFLLTKGCVTCHTGPNDGSMPYVNDTNPPSYGPLWDGIGGDTLAGGNFYWVALNGGQIDSTGHNVFTDNLAGQDQTHLNVPPGGTGLTQQLTCAGVYGCHGVRTPGNENEYTSILGAHHGDDSTIDGATVASSYRFLKGILGFEDNDWEYTTLLANDHNQYKGIARTDGVIDNTTISSLCAQCHNDFHNGTVNIGGAAWGSPWVRHPTDFDLSSASGTEYADYGGAAHTYLVSVPLASNNVDTPLDRVLQGSGDDAVITCISCHRAHGTPFASILRWNYKGWPNPDDSTVFYGCGKCHTSKN